MQSSRALGVFALCAVILAAIAFAAVDVTIANVNGCMGVSKPCTDTTMPGQAIGFAVIGTIALLASVLPAISWFINAIHHSQHDADIEPMRVVVARTSFDEDEL